MDPYIGRTLDSRYEILERIGTGGMAVVYKAKDNRLGRLVALKILRGELAQDDDLRRRFNAESQAVAQLSSPHIVAVYDVSRGGDTEYIVMELIDGITLKQYMEKRGRLNWRESLHFITQIMRGLAHAHSKGIVHRDIKPQNIMVLRDGSVKVADFGIAVLENASQTLTQQALGSVHYISPEQARGERTDARSDIYSAGVVLYEMLTGRLPFEGESAVSVALQHLNSTPPDPRSLDPDIPEQLELICMKAMAPDLRRRYSSAEAMIRDLEAFRKDPAMNLEFSMADLRPETVDEPTRPLRRQEARFHTGSLSPDSLPPAGGIRSGAERQFGEAVRNTDSYRCSEDQVYSGSRTAQNRYRSDYTPSALETDSRSARSDDRADDSRPGTVQTVLLCVGGVLALVLAFLLFRSILSGIRGGAPEAYVVRSVLGYTVEQAKELDDVKGIFEIRQEGQKPSSDYPAGAICQQDPEAGRTRKGGNLVIKVWISTGEETALMPNVVHQKPTQAEKGVLKNLIAQYGLTVMADEADMQYSDEFPAGYIISSDPAEGEVLRQGDTIRLVVSKGPHQWQLESFVGQKYFEQVRSLLPAMGLEPGDIRFDYSDQPFGTILSHSPAEGATVREGTKVDFTVSRGPEPGTPAVQNPDAVQEGSTDEPEPEQQDSVSGGTDSGTEQEAGGHTEPDDGQTSGTESGSGTNTGTGSETGSDTGTGNSTGDIVSSLTIALPQGQDSAHLEVFQNGKVVYEDYLPCNLGSFTVELNRDGMSLVRVFIDGTEIYNKTVDTGN